MHADAAPTAAADAPPSAPAAPRRARLRRSEAVALALATAVAGVLALANLDAQILWQDEAQSALLARTTLAHGIPQGVDGANSLSQELGSETDAAGRWRWHTWLHFYLVAASFALLGESTTAARLPAALFGIATLPLVFALGRALWRDRVAAWAAVAALLLLVPFWVLARQCRYYSLTAFFAVALLLGYVRCARGERGGGALLAVAIVALFHSHYVYVPPLLAAVALHTALFERARWRAVAGAVGAGLLVCAPWIVWQAGMDYGASYADTLADPAFWWSNAVVFARRLLAHTSGLAWLGAGLAGAAALAWRGGGAALRSALSDRGVALVGLAAGLVGATLSVVAPGPFFRYLAPLLPLVALGFGAATAALARLHGAAALAAVLAFGALQPLAPFAHELRSGFDGPLEGLVAYLREHARPGDVVWITYGDMPLKFYTSLRVVGGLTGEDLERALHEAPPDWIVIRHTVVHEERDGRVRRFLEQRVDLTGFRKIELPFADTAFENREEPGEHRFHSARRGPPVVVYARRR